MNPSPNAVDTAISSAPRPVQEYIEDGLLSDAVVRIATPYMLHIDVVGRLAELTRNLLIGLSSPAEVVGELIMSGMDADTAKKLLADLNEKIFIPMRERVRSGKSFRTEEEEDQTSVVPPVARPSNAVDAILSAPAPVAPPMPEPLVPAATLVELPPTPAPVPVSAPTYVPPVLEAPVQVVPPAPVTPPMPQPIPVPVQAPAMPVFEPVPAPAPAVPVSDFHPSMRTMATDIQAVQENRSPEPVPAPGYSSYVPPAPSATPATPSSIPQQAVPPQPKQVLPTVEAPGPRTGTPPVNLPGAPVIKQYGVDPYREPLQ